MLVSVKTLKQETFTVEATPEIKVEDFRKAIIAQRPPKEGFTYKILTKGKILEDGKTLHEYGIIEDTNCFVVILESKQITQKKVEKPVDIPPSPVLNSAPVSSLPLNPASDSDSDINLPSAQVPNNGDIPENLFDMALSAIGSQNNNDGIPIPIAIIQQLTGGALSQEMINDFMKNPDLLNNFIGGLMAQMTLDEFGPGMDGVDVSVISTDDPLQDGPTIKNIGEGKFEIHMTNEQKVDIDELTSLGIDMVVAIEYYKAYGNNKEAAANAIMDELYQN